MRAQDLDADDIAAGGKVLLKGPRIRDDFHRAGGGVQKAYAAVLDQGHPHVRDVEAFNACHQADDVSGTDASE